MAIIKLQGKMGIRHQHIPIRIAKMIKMKKKSQVLLTPNAMKNGEPCKLSQILNFTVQSTHADNVIPSDAYPTGR